MASEKFKKLTSLLAAVILLVTMLAGCGGESNSTDDTGSGNTGPSTGNSTDTGSNGDTQTVGEKVYYTYASDATNFSPTQNVQPSYFTIAALYRYIPNNEGTAAIVVPDLAAGDPHTEDGYTWFIEIDQNAKWANGEPINADTFIYSWQQILDPHVLYPNGSGAAKNYIEIEGAYDYYIQESAGTEISWDDVGLKKVDDYTVSVTTVGKYSANDVKLQFRMPYTAPLYEPLYEECFNADKTDNTYGTDVESLMASGPYNLVSWTKGAERVFERNDNYLHADEIHLDSIISKVVTDESTQLELFENGELDYLALGINGVVQYGDDPRVIPYQSFVVYGIEFNFENPDKPYLNNVNFRKALFYGIDRQSVATATANTPANFFLSSNTLAYSDGTTIGELREEKGYVEDNYSYDPERAKQYFETALQETGVDKVSVQLVYSESNNSQRQVSEFIQSSLQELFGADKFEMTLTAMSSSAMLDLMRTAQNGPTNGWDLAWQGWDLAAATIYPNRKFEVYTSSDTRRVSNYNNAGLDALYEQSISEEARLDEELRAEIAMEMEQLVLDEMLQVPVWNTLQYFIFSDRVILRSPYRLVTYQFGEAYADLSE